jgi:hypothetical protein
MRRLPGREHAADPTLNEAAEEAALAANGMALYPSALAAPREGDIGLPPARGARAAEQLPRVRRLPRMRRSLGFLLQS